MKKELTAVWVFMLGGLVRAQNLVPNGSFEEYTTCPDYFSQWALVDGWTSPYTTSADYFNSCAGGDICNVPFNQFGYQQAYDGNAYMGLATFEYGGQPLYREVIATELLQPLEVGVPVCVSFRTTCGGYGSAAFNSAAWKARGPGLQFFTELPSDWETYLYPNTAAIYMDTVLSDTTNWVLVSGTFVPDSAYRYIAIANFFEDSLSWPSELPEGGAFPAAYAFVDDVRISADLALCGLPTDVRDDEGGRVQAISDPFGAQLVLHFSASLPDGSQVTLWNAQGELMRAMHWPKGQRELVMETSDLATGIYLVRLNSVPIAAGALNLIHFLP